MPNSIEKTMLRQEPRDAGGEMERTIRDADASR